jgi:hypothetical protein
MNTKVLVLATLCSVATDIHAADNCTGSEATVDSYTKPSKLAKTIHLRWYVVQVS